MIVFIDIYSVMATDVLSAEYLIEVLVWQEVRSPILLG